MKEKKKNILVYVGIVVAVIIVIVTAFILGTKVGNTPDENGATNTNNNVVSMTKEELKNHLTTFIENYDVENEIGQNYFLQHDDEFWFAVRVYLNTTKDGKKQLNEKKGYKIPSDKIMEIAKKYFFATDEIYDLSGELVNVSYDENSKNYIIDESYDFLLPTFDGIKHSTSLSELTENGVNKVATLKVLYDDNTYDEYTFLLGTNYKIMSFAKSKTSNSTKTFDNINYEVKTTTIDKTNVTDNNYIDMYTQLYVNDTLVEIGDSNSKLPYSFSPIVIKQLDDILIANVSLGNNDARVYAIDKDGKVIKEFSNIKGKTGYAKVYGSNLYVNSLGDSIKLDIDETKLCEMYKTNPEDIYSYIEKIEYLGNGQFSEQTLTKTYTVKEYVEKNKFNCN